MNYFEFYGISVSFFPDEAALKRQFYANSKAFHPDFYAGASVEEQAEVLEKSTLNNKAWQVLSSFDKRLAYILSLKGMLEEGDKYTLPQDFLMEMMDINEALMDLEMGEDAGKLEQLQAEVAQQELALDQEIKLQAVGFEGQSEGEQMRILAGIKDAYYRKKYLLRIRDSLNRFAAR